MLTHRLATSLLIALVSLVVTPPPEPDVPASDGGIETQYSNNRSDIGISGTRTTRESDGSAGNYNEGSGGNTNDGYEGVSDGYYVPSGPRTVLDQFCLTWTSFDQCIGETYPDATPEEIEEIAAIPAITITDLARFAPAGTPIAGEPDNLGVAGLPTNFVADATVQTQTGELFDFPISVRFTPATYTFSYGDGTSVSGAEGGATWDALGQAQFTPTATSHTYAERGTYDARVDVAYTAEIDLGGGWFPVAGQLATTGPAQEIRIFEAHTALVANTCAERPSAPGC